jgi:hypothetical protein
MMAPPKNDHFHHCVRAPSLPADGKPAVAPLAGVSTELAGGFATAAVASFEFEITVIRGVAVGAAVVVAAGVTVVVVAGVAEPVAVAAVVEVACGVDVDVAIGVDVRVGVAVAGVVGVDVGTAPPTTMIVGLPSAGVLGLPLPSFTCTQLHWRLASPFASATNWIVATVPPPLTSALLLSWYS